MQAHRNPDVPNPAEFLTYELRMRFPLTLIDAKPENLEQLCVLAYNTVIATVQVAYASGLKGPIPPSKMVDFEQELMKLLEQSEKHLIGEYADQEDQRRWSKGDLMMRDTRTTQKKLKDIERIKKEVVRDKKWEIRKRWWKDNLTTAIEVWRVFFSVVIRLLGFIHNNERPIWDNFFWLVWRFCFLLYPKATGFADGEYVESSLFSKRVQRGKQLLTRGIFTLDFVKYVFIALMFTGTAYLMYRGLFGAAPVERDLFTALQRCITSDGRTHFTNCAMPQRLLDPEVDPEDLFGAVLDPALYVDMPRSKQDAGNDIRIVSMGSMGTHPLMVEQLRVLLRTESYGRGCVCAHHAGWPVDVVAVSGEVMQAACFRNVREANRVAIEVADELFGNRTVLMPPVAEVEFLGHTGKLERRANMQTHGLCVARCAWLSGRGVEETMCE